MAATHLGNLPQRPWQMVGSTAWRQGSWQLFRQNRNCQVKIYKKICYSPVKLLHNSNGIIGGDRFFPNYTHHKWQVHSKYNTERSTAEMSPDMCYVIFKSCSTKVQIWGCSATTQAQPLLHLLRPHSKAYVPTKVMWADPKECHWPVPDAGSCSKGDRRVSHQGPLLTSVPTQT